MYSLNPFPVLTWHWKGGPWLWRKSKTCLKRGQRYFSWGVMDFQKGLCLHAVLIFWLPSRQGWGDWKLTWSVASGFSYKANCPAVNSMGTGQETRRSYCANKEGSWGEQSLTTQRKSSEEISAHPRRRRQTSPLRILKAQGLGRGAA